MPRAFAISAALGLALATGWATTGSAMAAPATPSTATVHSVTAADHGGWGDWDDDDGDCNGTGNICA